VGTPRRLFLLVNKFSELSVRRPVWLSFLFLDEHKSLFAQRGAAPELNISGTQVLLTITIILCLGVPLVWTFVKSFSLSP